MDTLDAKRASGNTQKKESQIHASSPQFPVDAATPIQTPASTLQSFRYTWLPATLSILPVYIAVHIGFFLTTCLSYLFTHRDFDGTWVPLRVLPEAWHHWDTGYYMVIAKFGYQKVEQTAFFPLYGLLERALLPIVHNPLVAGLIISDIAGFFLLIVLYQLVREDIDEERANRTVLYLSLFPTAFFLAAGYNEALFLCLVLLSFYNMRHGRWWLAGLFGFFASLTRSAGIFLLFPFCYEYLRQHEFTLRRIRFDVVSGSFIAAGIAVYAFYCYYRFHDFLAFSHAQAHWNHLFEPPWYGIVGSLKSISESGGLIGFQSIRNLLDLVPDLMMLVLIVLIFVGPWKFPRSMWSYGIYAAIVYIFLQLFPIGGTGLFPLQSVGRYLLELFPTFIVLAAFGKYRMFHMNYLVISGALLFFLLTQFLTGHWVL
ncbi:MAG: hypothetical protein NVSMB54_24510 [Ktedonobacteraceae bacterium]